jgi:serine/threonine protein kinase
MEKHALIKIRENCDSPLPAVRLATTFKDDLNLYFVTELLNHKFELWEHCRSFGLINPELARFTFRQICLSVSKIHALEIVHRDLKVSNF